jgi:hypothetical protein
MGSKLGWILAAVLVASILTYAAWQLLPGLEGYFSATRPTRATTARGMLSLLGPAEPLSLALGKDLSGEGDAGDDYDRALKAYRDNRSAIREICRHAPEVAQGQYRLIDDDLMLLKQVAEPITAGAAKRKMTYVFRKTPKVIKIPYFAAEAEAFQDLCDVPRMLAVHYESTGEDGSTYNELFAVVWRIQRRGRVYGPHPGDIFNLVENHQDRAVRVEAILGLGVVKLTVAGRGDRRRTAKLIGEKLLSEDEIERAAAGCAESLDAAGLKQLAGAK